MGGQSFKVEPRYLVGYADQLQRQAQIFEEMRAHMDKYGRDVHGLEGILQEFADMCVALADWQVRILRDMHGKMNSTVAALKATATDYQEADESGAVDMAEIDKKLPDGRADGPSGRYELRDESTIRGVLHA